MPKRVTAPSWSFGRQGKNDALARLTMAAGLILGASPVDAAPPLCGLFWDRRFNAEAGFDIPDRKLPCVIHGEHDAYVVGRDGSVVAYFPKQKPVSKH